MFYFNGIIVVEGKADVAFLSSFIMSEYVITNGYELPKSEIAYLEAASKIKQVLVITDPDEPGETIRARLNIPNSINIFAKKIFRSKKKKHGIAECEKDEIVRVLNGYLSEKSLKHNDITVSFLSSIGLNTKINRTIFSKKVPVGTVNMKKLTERLNSLNYTREEIIKIVGERLCS
jgi:ribonuclease M5